MAKSPNIQEAFEKLKVDFNVKIEEAKSNIQNISQDIKTQVEGQRENLTDYKEKLASKYNEIVDVDKIKNSVLAEAENLIDEVKERLDKVFDYVQDQLKNDTIKETFAKVEKSVDNATDRAKEAIEKATGSAKTVAKKAKKEVEKTTAKAKVEVEKVATKAKAEVKKTVTAAEKATKTATSSAKTTATKAKTTATTAAEKVKKAAEKA